MTTEQAYINGFVKRAADYGYSQAEAISLYKEALLFNYFVPKNGYKSNPYTAEGKKELSIDKNRFNSKTLPHAKHDPRDMLWSSLEFEHKNGKMVEKKRKKNLEDLLDTHHVFGARYEDLVKATSGHSLYGTKGRKTKDFLKDMHPIPPSTLKDIAEKLRGATKEQIAGKGGFHESVRGGFTKKKLNKKEVNTFADLLDNYANQGASMYPSA
jgi:hypothetical protein